MAGRALGPLVAGSVIESSRWVLATCLCSVKAPAPAPPPSLSAPSDGAAPGAAPGHTCILELPVRAPRADASSVLGAPRGSVGPPRQAQVRDACPSLGGRFQGR